MNWTVVHQRWQKEKKEKKQEKKETSQSVINEDDADTISSSFKTFGKSDSITDKGFMSGGFCLF